MQVSVKLDICDLAGCPRPDDRDEKSCIFTNQRSILPLLTNLQDIILVKDQKDLPVKVVTQARKTFDNILDECLVQGIREEDKTIDNNRIHSSWSDFYYHLDEGRITILCIIECNGQMEEFETFLFPEKGEIIVPQKIIARLCFKPGEKVIIEYKRKK